MKICIAGKNSIAINVFDQLIEMSKNDESIEIVAISNHTDLGIDGWQKSFKKHVLKSGKALVDLKSIYDEQDLLFLSLEYDRIINPERFKSSKLFNIHFSLLPQYKGMYTSAHPILNGERQTGVTLHEIDKGIDTGDIIAQRIIKIDKTDSAKDLYYKYLATGAELVLEWIDTLLYKPNELQKKPQATFNSSYYSKDSINYKNLSIDVVKTAYEIQNQIRAFSFREYQLPKVLGYVIIDSSITQIKSRQKPGTIVENTDSYIKLATIDYDIILWIDRLKELNDCIMEENIEMLRHICLCNKHINDVNAEGHTPLMVAIVNKKYKAINELIELGADKTSEDYTGKSVMEYARENDVLSLVDL